MSHVGDVSLHDDVHGLPALAAAIDVGTASSAAESHHAPPHTQSVTPIVEPSVATQSAVYEEPGADGHPVYRGFQDPKTQSHTFKKLQNLIESGEGKKSCS